MADPVQLFKQRLLMNPNLSIPGYVLGQPPYAAQPQQQQDAQSVDINTGLLLNQINRAPAAAAKTVVKKAVTTPPAAPAAQPAANTQAAKPFTPDWKPFLAANLTPNYGEETLKTKTGTTTDSKEQMILSAPQYIDLMDRLRNFAPPGLQASRADREALKQMLVARLGNEDPRRDYSALAGLTDAWSKDKEAAKAVTDSYKRFVPKTADQQFAENAGLVETLRKGSIDEAKAEDDLIKAITGSQIVQRVVNETSAGSEYGQAKPSGGRAMSPEAKIKEVQRAAERQLKDINKLSDESVKSLANLSSGNPITDMAGTDAFLKQLIGGRLSNFDLVTQGRGSKAYLASLRQKLETALTGTLTEENRGFYLDALRISYELLNYERELRLAQVRDFGQGMHADMNDVDKTLGGFKRGDKGQGVAHREIKSPEDKKTEQGLDNIKFDFNAPGALERFKKLTPEQKAAIKKQMNPKPEDKKTK